MANKLKQSMTIMYMRAVDETHKYLKIAQETYQDVILPTPEVRFTNKGSSAGAAARNGAFIRYHSVLLAENTEHFLKQTVPHEVAHVVACAVYGHNVQAHGREWQKVMRLFGAEPKRCHSYDMTNAGMKRQHRHDYHCECTDYQLTTVRHNRIRRGQRYRCRLCGMVLLPGTRAEVG